MEPVVDADRNLSFGCDEDGSEITFKGWLDEIRLGAGSLSADRIKADYETVVNPDFFTAGPSYSGCAVIVR